MIADTDTTEIVVTAISRLRMCAISCAITPFNSALDHDDNKPVVTATIAFSGR